MERGGRRPSEVKSLKSVLLVIEHLLTLFYHHYLRHNALDLVSEENVSVVAHIRPSLKRSFNLAAYVNVSETLQQLLKLQVDLSKLDRHHQLASHVVRADFEADIQPYILWLVREGGVAVADVGAVLNRNPFILMVSC